MNSTEKLRRLARAAAALFETSIADMRRLSAGRWPGDRMPAAMRARLAYLVVAQRYGMATTVEAMRVIGVRHVRRSLARVEAILQSDTETADRLTHLDKIARTMTTKDVA